jgi:hypothetical protein
MAQSASRSKSSTKSRSTSPRKSSGGSRSKTAATRRTQAQRRASATRSRSASSRRKSNGSRSSNGQGTLDSVREAIGTGAKSAKDTVAEGAHTTGDAVSTAAKKAKGPALAGGAALAGLAGGLAIAGRGGGRRRVLGVPVPGTKQPLVKINTPRRVKARHVSKDLLHAAGEVGSAGRQVGELVTEVQRVRAELDRGRRRSPIEVVLEGLTSRRVRG